MLPILKFVVTLLKSNVISSKRYVPRLNKKLSWKIYNSNNFNTFFYIKYIFSTF